jgi:hypothetical protein
MAGPDTSVWPYTVFPVGLPSSLALTIAPYLIISKSILAGKSP